MILAFIKDRWGTLIELVEDREIHGFHHVHLATTDPKATLKWYTEIFGSRVTRYAGVLAGIRYGDVWVLVKTLKHPPAPTRGRVIDRIVWAADLESTAERLRAARRNDPRPDAALTETARPADRLIFTGPDGVELEVRSPSKYAPVCRSRNARRTARGLCGNPRYQEKEAVGFRSPSGL